MYSVKGENTLFVTRGDSASFRLDLIDADGSPFVLQQDDKLTFTVKKTTSDKEALISKTVTNAIVLTPSDTNDLQLNRANGYVETIITPSTLIIGEEVTF